VYLHLIALEAVTDAHLMHAQYHRRFIASAEHPALRKARETEMHSLSSLSSQEQLTDNAVARRYQARRFPVHLSRYGFDIMVHYLRQQQLVLIMGIINQWISIEIVDTAVAAPAAPDANFLMSVGIGGEVDAAALNQVPLDLRLLQHSASHKYEEIKAEREEKEAVAKAEDENLTKKQRTTLQRLADAAKARRATVDARCIAPQIPLPPTIDERHSVMLAEMEFRETAGAGGGPVSADALPSAAMFTFVNARQTVNCAMLSPSADTIIGGFADSSVRLYPIDRDQAPQSTGPSNSRDASPTNIVLRGHVGPVYGVDYAADDKMLLSCSADGTVRLWSTELSAGLVAFRGHVLPVWDVAFAPDHGFYFASGGADRTARVWSTERTQSIRVFAGHQSDVDVVKWHPNCHYIATGSSDRTVRLWDVRLGGCCRVLSGHTSAITALAFSRDGTTLASADAGGAVRVWDLTMAQQMGLAVRHAGPVWSLDYSYGEGKLLASGGSDCTLRLWSEGGGSVGGLSCVSTWYTKATPIIAMHFTRRNLLLAAGPLSFEEAKSKG
jgi:transcription initiation factor TFIID subunit 5